MSVVPSLFCVCVHVVPVCPDKGTAKSHIYTVTMPDGRFPNKENLHVPGITRNPSLSLYITSCGGFFGMRK